ncbi:MAG: RelA/SpoT family protein [Bacteroidales bacterium]|jgi:GTP pyrophosphokinase|nr:RelA/SpoT family protein [Bacteroidales bacterium]
MSVLTVAEEIAIEDQFQELMHEFSFLRKEEDRDTIRRAFDLANEAHSDTRRKSGEPYMIHPLCVARIVVVEIGLGTTSVVSALLHDVVEDTDYTLDFIEEHFGKKVATIVDGLTKISEVFDNNSSLQAENFRKMLLTLSDDVRVILIKLADRLHNMRTLDALSPEKQIKIASETIFLYAPLAHRMGFYSIKQELEDLSLKYRHPKIYIDIVNLLKDNEEKRNQVLHNFMAPVREKLTDSGYKFEMTGRPKSIYSIYYKMQHKGVPFEEIYDLNAVRIVFEPDADISEKRQCWNIYSIITDIYTPKHDRIRDWVSTPKTNGYEALHITVMGTDGKWVEVQIRSRRMDDIAEKGFAAHWKYKGVASSESELDKWLRKIQEALKEPNSDVLEFIDDFKLNLFASEIQVFTPKGQIKTLPQKAIALDFAFDIHSGIGNAAIAAKVNHKLVPLNHVLQSGDQVEIITSDKKRTQREWMNDVVTTKAKTSIKNNIKAETHNRVEIGKNRLEQQLRENNVAPNSRVMKKLLGSYGAQTKEELYSKIVMDVITLDDLPKVLKKNSKNKWIRYWQLQLFGVKDRPQGKQEPDAPPLDYEIALCCSPIPGDDVIGYLNPKDGMVHIHKSRCPNAVKLLSSYAEAIVPVKWTTCKIFSFLVQIALQGIDRPDIYLRIISKITEEMNVNIRTFNLASHDGIFEGTIELYVHDTKDVEKLTKELKELKGVEVVKRLEILDQSKGEAHP